MCSLIVLDIFEPVGDPAAELQINRACPEPTPALKGAWRHIPTFRELILVKMTHGHIRAPLGSL
jgi:hypothetical protein